MYFPIFNEVIRNREITNVFGGYSHKLSCVEGQFYDMKNMTSKYFPMLSPRKSRDITAVLSKPQGIIDKEDLWWIDDGKLYRNGTEIPLSEGLLVDSPKTMVKMGAYIVIFPDKVWVKVDNDGVAEHGKLENFYKLFVGEKVTFSIADQSGNVITWHDAEYYKNNDPKEGDYQLNVSESGKASLKVFSATTGIWMGVTSTYMQIKADGIGKGFEADDGVKVTCDSNKGSFGNIFVNDEGDGKYSVNTYIVARTDDSITIPGIYYDAETERTDINLEVKRAVPSMSYVTECFNRLWGCSEDGHEIYCSKLGDVRNWNSFRGNATDSWATTIGSDGVFTGAITYGGYPMFFKEDSFIKIAVSSMGAHQTKETACRGVQKGSGNSLSILNEVLYYKSASCICAYNGGLPYSISDDLGDERYYDAVAGSVGDSYYISMRGDDGKYGLFVFDVKNGIWCKEDDTQAIRFCRHSDKLYFIDSKGNLTSVDGTNEGAFDWFVESGVIGYSSPDNKYVAKINVRLTLELGTNVDFYLQYDSNGEWVHLFNMSGKGTRSFAVPIIPRRCDHFKYRIVGKGDCKIHSVTKTIEEGSEP